MTTNNSAASTSGVFTAAAGEIIGPNGQPFIADGINAQSALLVAEGVTASQIMSEFPGMNMLRLAVMDPLSSPLPSQLQTLISQLTSAGVVVEIEDHNAVRERQRSDRVGIDVRAVLVLQHGATVCRQPVCLVRHHERAE